MDIPSHDQLMNPTLSALHSLGGSASIPEIVEHVITELQLDPEVPTFTLIPTLSNNHMVKGVIQRLNIDLHGQGLI